MFVGVGAGLCVRAGGAPGGDDALAMSVCKATGWDIRWAYLASDLIVLLLSLSYLDAQRIAMSLLTVILSGQIIGVVQKPIFLPERQEQPVGEH
ncbi:MAG: YitT family protein, partial [Negativibacillus sp.]|nr:YitT family protein [Negativibacillus sp.]